ncbi:MAG: hypothetical protein ACK4JC_10125 [Silanimonas lenta]
MPHCLRVLLASAALLAAGALPAAVRPIADRYVLKENAPATDLRVLQNDGLTGTELANGVLTLLRPPALGAASVETFSTASAADDVIRYTPQADRSGQDSLRYRICSVGACAEAEVAIVLRPISEGLVLTVPGSSGFLDLEAGGLRALPSARFQASPLVEAQVSEFPLAVDASPANPFAGNGAFSLRVIPSSGEARAWRILVDARSLSGGNVDVYLGVDANGDGRASADELRCAAGMSTSIERCEMELLVPACGNLGWWMLLKNAGSSAHTARVETFEVPAAGGDGSLVATGPGQVPARATFPLRLAWDAPEFADGQSRVAYVEVRAGAEAPVGAFPVRLTRSGRNETGLALASGREQRLRLLPGSASERVYVDVPAGATSLSVSARGSEPLQLYLARIDPPAAGSAPPEVAPAPARTASHPATASAAPSQMLSVSGTALSPGRWYVVASNPGPRAADVALLATIGGSAPRVRPGGYFAPARSGHGLFLYPAADQWAGLWYTYLQDGRSTWYYLQGPAPGANGQWVGRIYRSAWDGSRNVLTAIGEAVTTPTGPDAFRFAYRLDGQAGNEPFVSFGRGCPSLGGTALDASSHWYNPARSGTGYSVQLYPDYEFYAAFVYDAAGVPRFLVAERSGFGGTSASLTLEQLTGFCPLCTRSGPPLRQPVGVLGRTYAAGRLASLSLDASFTAGVPGRWQQSESVQLLGGAGTTQGCLP